MAAADTSAPVIINGLDELAASQGRSFGPTEWLTMTQERINQFADATGTTSGSTSTWSGRESGPFGGTIAHGYLTLSLCRWFLGQLIVRQGISMGINYGIDKARFTSPVPAGRVRARGEVVSVTEVAGGVQAVVRITVELEARTSRRRRRQRQPLPALTAGRDIPGPGLH